jgi:hypothetical protein
MIGRLDQPDPREAPLCHPSKDVLHQLASDRAILHGGIDRDRPDARHGRTLIEEVAADDLAVKLGDHRIEAGVCKQPRQEFGGDCGRGKIRRKVVLRSDRLEGFVTDRPTARGVCGVARS